MANTETQTDQQLRIPPGPERSLQRIEEGGAVSRELSVNGGPSNPEEMREEIERTRERMSQTLDLIEDRLVRQKEDLWAKATMQGFRRRISSEPWRSMAIAFVVGYVVAAIRD